MSSRSSLPRFAVALVLSALAAVALAAVACSGDESSHLGGTGGSGASGAAGGSSAGGAGGFILMGGASPHADFPEAPVVEGGLSPDIASLFETTPGDGQVGPCLAEPALGAMMPTNWAPLLFEWLPPAELNVFELRLEIDNQLHPLVVYTTAPSYTVATSIWANLGNHSAGHDIAVTLRGARLEGGVLTIGPRVGASGVVHVAPVAAPGSVVYWAATGGTSFQGFTIGDTVPKTVLTPALAGAASSGGNTNCISCHASSPDGKLVVYSRDTDTGTRAIDVRTVVGAAVPAASDVSPSALALLGRHKQTAPVLSAAHYSAADAVVVSVFSDPGLNGGRYELIWTDLHAADASGWGVLARNGDARNVSSPSWRRDGTALAYVSSPAGGEGVIADTTAGDPTMDIYTVPYNARQGGDATPLPGASDPGYREFYPVYSPDDALLAFNRTDQPVNSYNQPSAEVLVVPSAGGTALRLAANDPPACTGLTSPGLTNSWARWAPQSETVGNRKFYWLVFSSKRRPASNAGGALLPQLYVSAVVTEVTGGVETIVAEYPALYVTAQNPTEGNHTPAWDYFEVSQIPD
ncbi:MAG: hypothetical protein IT373_29585 [Polyangiaceae bacterium]|nr:hypothetical protein [Polyangiaceae bacterium]